jgi:hypothetical protein
MPEVGDTVCYYPDKCYAFDQQLTDGRFPWDFGVERVGRDGKREVQTLSVDEVDMFLRNRARDFTAELRPIAPRTHWEAKVTAVGDDGSLDLEVCPGRPGILLLMPGVSQADAKDKKPHTWHTKEE